MNTRCVLVGKDGGVRARLVASDVKSIDASEAHLFAATPPLDALKVLVSLAASNKNWTLD